MSNRIVITTYGSLGDLHPYIAIALELKERGHQAVIATSELYRSRIEVEGIEFYPIRPDVSFLANNNKKDKEIIKRAMDSIEGPKYVTCELVLPHLKDTYEDLLDAVHGADLLITHPCSFAAPLVVEKTGICWVSSGLSPISILSAYDSLVLSSQSNQICSEVLNPLINSVIIGLGKLVFYTWSEPIRQLRAELGLSQGLDPLFKSHHTPDLILALFSQVFAKPQPDWPKQTLITGFTFYDRQGEAELPPELSKFLDAGPPPIIFTLGSAAVHIADNFYIESALAAKQLGYRAVLLVGEDKRNLPRNLLSENIAAFDYAPYSELFPKAVAIVHQGGIGTTAQALRAGHPMLIVPYSHDQPNNAARAERLGVARTIARGFYTAERAAAELKQLLNNPSYSKRAADIGRQIQAEDGVRATCDAIEARLNLPI